MPSPQVSPVRARGATALAPAGAAIVFTYIWWALIVFEPDRFLASFLGGPVSRIPTLFLPLLLVVVAGAFDPRRVYWPLVPFLLLNLVAVMYAANRGFAFASFKVLFIVFVACAAVMVRIRAPQRAMTILKIYLLGYLWYGVHGLPNGLVGWHHELGNQDGFGPLMCIGFGFSYYFGQAAPSRRWRLIAYGIAGLCCVGVVAAFARGAVLSFAAVALILWLRSPHKLRALAAGFAAALVTLGAIQILYPHGEFWEEMSTVTEGTDEGTTQSRWVMWTLGIQLWKNHPVLGVGAGNFGAAATAEIPDDPSRAQYTVTAQLYNQPVHNVYVQVLCENGIVGLFLFLGMVIDFFRRVRGLRTPAAMREWQRRGGDFNLHALSLALELGMIAFLLNCLFYNMLYMHWFWTLISLAFVLGQLSMPRRRPAPSPVPARGEASTEWPSPAATPPPGDASLGARLRRGRG